MNRCTLGCLDACMKVMCAGGSNASVQRGVVLVGTAAKRWVKMTRRPNFYGDALPYPWHGNGPNGNASPQLQCSTLFARCRALSGTHASLCAPSSASDPSKLVQLLIAPHLPCSNQGLCKSLQPLQSLTVRCILCLRFALSSCSQLGLGGIEVPAHTTSTTLCVDMNLMRLSSMQFVSGGRETDMIQTEVL